ncbi:hypothetical protein [Paraburkholderia sp. HD33-4]|uniref:hypothetical protein n=1 Tax=Paraburkholderia sp. HD33-4 TaxID=2883242 RepID=UPI001F40FF13|nr:hypothetical protein [Paraburkholderia sp. HD33-4]
MYGINDVSVQSFYSQTPETFKALQRLVTVLDDFYGPRQLLVKLADQIGRTIAAMRSDGVITPQSSAVDIHGKLQERFTRFFEAFVTRAGAHAAAAVIFNDKVSRKVSRDIVETYVIYGV